MYAERDRIEAKLVELAWRATIRRPLGPDANAVTGLAFRPTHTLTETVPGLPAPPRTES